MHLTLTVVDPTTGALDVEVDAPSGTTLGDVRGELLATVRTGGCGDDGLATLRHESRALPDAAPLGRPPLVDGAVVTVGDGGVEPATGLLELHVCAGPDAGQVHRLPPGDHLVGRGVDATVRVADPRLSRVHCLLRLGHDATRVVDLGSANGTSVDGRPVPAGGREVRPGEVVEVGDSRLELVVARTAPAAPVDDDGHLLVAAPPRLGRVATPAPLVVPAAPVPREPARLPLAAVALPALVGAGLLLVTRDATSLLFVLLSPVTALGAWLGDRLERRRGLRRDQARVATAHAVLRAEAAARAAQQTAEAHARHPGVSRLAHRARSPDRPVWSRAGDDADLLAVRLGLGSLPADLPCAGEAGQPVPAPPSVAGLTLDGVPVPLSTADHSPTGVAGPRATVQACLRSWLVQLACLHGPSLLRVAVTHEGPPEAWSWLRWLPHRLGAEVPARQWLGELDRRLAESGRPGSPRWVLVVDGPDVLRRLPGAARLLAEGAAVGLHLVVAARSDRQLPAACRALVTVGADGTMTLRRHDTGEVTGIRPDGVSRATAESVARSLAPLREAVPAVTVAAPPTVVSLGSLVRSPAAGLSALDPDAVAARWTSATGLGPVPIGVGADGRAVVLDLVADGPHALLAGTTGSGKSELLQSLVAGLAAMHPPDQVAFVLVDFKGGAAFRSCARLPHTLGLVTDLDAHQADRLLRSLRGLVADRERRLGAAGAADLGQYVERGARPALPRLLVVVDEFATLHDELPDAVGELVSLARRGRSLGLHLVLATQRPAGAVSNEIRANVALRLCLRVSDAAESVDVIDDPAAAALPAHLPGRGYLRRSGRRLIPLQAARVTGCGTDPADRVRVRRAHRPDAGVPAAQAPPAVPGDSDLDRLVRACRAAATRLHVPSPPAPWLPPLPDRLAAVGEAAAGEADGPGVVLGLADLPDLGRQSPHRVDPVGRGLLVTGAPRSGRSQTLLTVAARLAARHGSGELHLYALDGNSRALHPLEALPHCAALAPPDDPAFAARVLRALVTDLARREADPSGRAARPAVLLLVDDWTSWRPALEELDAGHPVDDLLRLARSGPTVGLGVALSGDRDLLGSRLGDAFAERLVLRLADRADYALAGVAPRAVPHRLPPGRGVRAPDGVEVQVLEPAAVTPGSR